MDEKDYKDETLEIEEEKTTVRIRKQTDTRMSAFSATGLRAKPER